MNIEAYNPDTLRKLVRDLQKENKELRALLQKANVPCAQSEAFLETPERAEDYDPDQGARILRQPVNLEMAKRFYGMFWGREDVIGVYPLLPDGTCRFLAFDFDNHEKGAEREDFANTDHSWRDEADALRLICRQNGMDALGERSRSGMGAHVWIFSEGRWMRLRQGTLASSCLTGGLPPST